MNVEELRLYCLSKKGASEDFPFDEVTLVFRVMGKIFAITPLDAELPTVNLKCDPERAVNLREEYDEEIKPGFHMNKKHWNTVSLDGNLSAALIKELVDHSYSLVAASLKKALQQELSELQS